jgi:hypothetical protein
VPLRHSFPHSPSPSSGPNLVLLFFTVLLVTSLSTQGQQTSFVLLLSALSRHHPGSFLHVTYSAVYILFKTIAA